MKLTSTSFADNQKIPGEFAFCVPDPAHHVCLGKIATRSSLGPDILPAQSPSSSSATIRTYRRGTTSIRERSHRARFAATRRFLPLGVGRSASLRFTDCRRRISSDVTRARKIRPGQHTEPVRGTNDYTGWFAGDGDMRGDYFWLRRSLPWNDEIRHRYAFRFRT